MDIKHLFEMQGAVEKYIKLAGDSTPLKMSAALDVIDAALRIFSKETALTVLADKVKSYEKESK